MVDKMSIRLNFELILVVAVVFSSCSPAQLKSVSESEIIGEWTMTEIEQNSLHPIVLPKQSEIVFGSDGGFSGIELPFVDKFDSVSFVSTKGIWKLRNASEEDLVIKWRVDLLYKSQNTWVSWNIIQTKNDQIVLKYPYDLDSGAGFSFSKRKAD